MSKKQQIILLHGSEKFTDKNLITKGELVIEHGANAKEVKLHTLDNNGEIATIASQAYIDDKVAVLSGDTTNLSNTVSALDEAYKAADIALGNRIDANASAITAESSAREAAILAEQSARTEAITAEASARTAADEALDGKIAANTASIETLNGGADKAGSVAYAINNAKSQITTAFESADTQIREAYKAADEALGGRIDVLSGEVAGINTEYTGKFAALEQTIANNLQSAKTYTDELRNNEVSANTAAIGVNAAVIAEIKADYLKNEDKTALSNLISAEASARENADKGLNDKITAITNDYLKLADKNELKGLITAEQTARTEAITAEASARTAADEALDGKIAANAASIAVLNGDDTGMSVRQIANHELATVLISGATTVTDALDTLQEIADWIQKHPEDAAAMNTAIEANATAITAEAATRAAADEALDAKIAANATAITAEASARENADKGLSDRITAITNDYLKTADKNELKGLITAETSARTAAISALQSQIDNLDDAGFVTDGELETAVDALEKKITTVDGHHTVVVKGTDANNNLTISTAATATGGVQYTIGLNDVAKDSEMTALDERVDVIETTFVKTVEAYVKETDGISKKALTGNTIDLTTIVIDGGTY